MSDNSEILDAQLDGGEENIDVESKIASSSQRFINFIIDRVFIYILFVGLGFLDAFAGTQYLEFIASNWFLDVLVTSLTMVLYCTVTEAVFGKTIGKVITRTKVVDLEGQRPELMNLLGRNLVRLIPFEAFSFLGSSPVGWHDSMSDTRVIVDE